MFFFLQAIIPLAELKYTEKTPPQMKYSYMHPMVGYLGYQTGLIYNMRFFGNYIAGVKQDQRDYAADQNENDPVWRMVRILFPSTGGQLATTSEAQSNFGNKLGKSKESVKKLVELMKYAHDARLPELAKRPKSPTDNAARKSEEAALKQAIYEATSKEEELGYPKYIVEQILLTFLWCHFDAMTSDDANVIQTFYENLPDDFSTSESDSSQQEALDYVIALGVQKGLTPYHQASVQAVGNGSAKKFDRGKNSFLDGTFADCVETAIRHLCTILFYDPQTQTYHVPLNASPDLTEFFSKLSDPNSGDTLIRSAWNKVVADLNKSGDAVPVIYKREGKNEIRSGLLNCANILIRICNAHDLMPKLAELFERLQKAPQFKETDQRLFIEEVEKLFSNIFSQFNKNHSYDVKISSPSFANYNSDPYDLFGSLKVEITEENNMLEVNYFTKIGHTEITSIKDYSLIENLALPTVNANTLQGPYQLISLLTKNSNTVSDSFYQLMGRKLIDNTAYLRFIQSFSILNKYPNSYLQPLTYVLSNISYDDEHTVEQLSPTIINLYHKAPNLIKEIINQKVESVEITKDTDKIALEWSNLKKIVISKNLIFENLNISQLNHLKSLTIPCIISQSLNIAQNTSLEMLEIGNDAKIDSLILGANSSLKELKIYGAVKGIVDVSSAKNLEELILSNGANIDTLNLREKPHLKRLVIYSTVKGVLDLSLSSVLETLIIGNGQTKIDSLILSNNNSLLEYIDIDGTIGGSIDLSSILNLRKLVINGTIKGSVNVSLCSALENLKISDEANIGSLILGANPNLKKLVINSTIKESVDVSSCLDLEELEVSDKANIGSLILGTNPNLKLLIIHGVIKEPVDISLCQKLSNLMIGYNSQIKSLILGNNPQLQYLWINNLKELYSTDQNPLTGLKFLDSTNYTIDSLREYLREHPAPQVMRKNK